MVQQSSQIQAIELGDSLHVRSGRSDSFWALYKRGEWEPDTIAIFRRFIDRDHSYIDIGAWIGPTLLLGCRLAKRAYGIEPDPIAYAELAESIEYNRPLTDNVQLFNICIAPESGKTSFGSRSDGGDSSSSLLFAGNKTTWTVDGLNFQEWIDQNRIVDCNFIKIDIEGGEYSVIPTMAAYLRKNRPTLHLSLHPCFLGEQEGRGITEKIKRFFYRLKSTIRILGVLQMYKYIYDPRSKAPHSDHRTFRARIRNLLVGMSWKPVVLMLACLYSTRGGTYSLVLTDRKW